MTTPPAQQLPDVRVSIRETFGIDSSRSVPA